MAERCRKAADTALKPDAAAELIFLAEEHEAHAARVEQQQLACDPTLTISSPNR